MYLTVDYEKLANDLKNGSIEVTFDKIDGETRTIHCSLSDQFIPPINEDALPKEKKPRNLNAISVWDIQKDAWRSFRLDRVRSIKKL